MCNTVQEIVETTTKEIKPNHELRNVLDSPIQQEGKEKWEETLHSFGEYAWERQREKNDPFLCKMHSNIKVKQKWVAESYTSSSSLHLNTLAPKMKKRSVYIFNFHFKRFQFLHIPADVLCFFRVVEKKYEWFLCDLFLNTTWSRLDLKMHFIIYPYAYDGCLWKE